MAVWHRRAGKDSLGIHWTSVAAVKRVGIYWHMLPTLRQGRLVIWDGITRDGRRVLDAWPGADRAGKPDSFVAKRRNDEMKLELVNGSIWQVVGSDNYDSLMGANPIGVVFSEYSLGDPAAWDFIRPILVENGGWALFLYTPRGPNHGQALYDMATINEDWFAEKLTVEDTKVMSLEAVEEERRAGMVDELIRQEFYCSFDAPLVGSYYGPQMSEAQDEGRICGVPHDPAVEVETWWDLGFTDATAIWFVQRVGRELHMIDYYEASGESLSHYAGVIKEWGRPKSGGGRGYVYADHHVPHDAKAHELGTGQTRLEVMQSLGLQPNVVIRHRVDDGIEACRNLIPKCWFDAERCKRGIHALRSYRKELLIEDRWYSKTQPVFKGKPLHDWSSHGADAFRTGAMAQPTHRGPRKPIEYPDHPFV